MCANELINRGNNRVATTSVLLRLAAPGCTNIPTAIRCVADFPTPRRIGESQRLFANEQRQGSRSVSARCVTEKTRAGIDPFCGSGGFRVGLLEVAVAKKSVVVRKRAEEKPKPGIGLAHLLAQSGVVVDAFGPDRGFKLMVMALVASALVSGGAVFFAARGIARIFGW